MPHKAGQRLDQGKPCFDTQVWRPLTGPVQDSPLGMLDAATLSVDDIHSSVAVMTGRAQGRGKSCGSDVEGFTFGS